MFRKLQLLFKLNRIIFWNLAIRSVEETTHCGWPTVRGRDIFISSHWGAALTGYWIYFSIYWRFCKWSIYLEHFFDVHILKGPPGLFSNPEVKLERVYGVVTWETSGEMCMTSNFPLLKRILNLLYFSLIGEYDFSSSLMERLHTRLFLFTTCSSFRTSTLWGDPYQFSIYLMFIFS